MTVAATARLVTALLVAAGGMLVAVLTGRPEAAVLVAPWLVLLVLGLSDGVPDRFRTSMTVDHDRFVVDSPVTLTTTIAGLDGGWVEVGWRPPSRFDRDPAERFAVADAVGPDGRVELTATLQARGWGTHDVGRVAVGVHRPYGLLVARAEARQPLPVRVHPSPIDLRSLLAPRHVRRLTGVHRSKSAGRGIEFADIRPFGPGDTPRDINWRASARSQDLMVSQRHPDRSTHAILLLDSFADSGHDTLTVLGEAIEATIALAESHLAVSDRVGLVDFGGVIRWVSPGTGRHQMQRLVDALLSTRLFPSEAERSIGLLPPRALPPRSFVIALSPLLDKRFIDGLFALRGAGHDLAVVELTPPLDLHDDRWDDGVPAAALALWRAERAMRRDRLAELGMTVVTRAAGAAPGREDDPNSDVAHPLHGGPGDESLGAEPWDQVLHRLASARRRVGPRIRA